MREFAGPDTHSVSIRIRQFRHGTTVGANASIHRTGAHVGLITTVGLRDILHAACSSRRDWYDSDWDPPPPLVRGRDLLTVPKRVDHRGRVLTQLDACQEVIG